jgi:uncharacterized protein with von Willebrand factor type A (vWA) domain
VRAHDSHSLLQVLDDLLWAIRREGVRISTAQAVVAAKAVEAVGLERPADLRHALAAVLVSKEADRSRFEQAFATFADPAAAPGHRTLRDSIVAAGFNVSEASETSESLSVVASPEDAAIFEAWVVGGVNLESLLAGAVPERLGALAGPQLGFLLHGLLNDAGAAKARNVLAGLRQALVRAFGARGETLASRLADELRHNEAALLGKLRRSHQARVAEHEAELAMRRLPALPFRDLHVEEAEKVRQAVRRIAFRLRARARLRARRARRGRLDPHRTLRAALATWGVPARLSRVSRDDPRPRLLLLCDVSDSVRTVAGLLLEFVHAAHELFPRTRSFVFVSGIAEVTKILARPSAPVALERVWGEAVSSTGHDSNYGRALHEFEERHLHELDRHTAVVVLGDGRGNFHEPAAEILDRVRKRVRSLLWLATEPRARWGQGDSAMRVYAPRCTRVLEVCCLTDLEDAARLLASLG